MWAFIKQIGSEWSKDSVPRLGAALAYYTALSIAPLLVIALSLAALFFGDEAARNQIDEQLSSLVGAQGGKAIQDMIANADRPRVGGVATILSIGTLLLGAAGVFGELQSSLNTIWGVKPKEGRGVWGFLRDRFLSFAMVLGIAFLLLVSLLLNAALAAVTKLVYALPESAAVVGHIIDFSVALLVVTILFALMFKLLPDVKMAWRDVWLGAFVTSLCFNVGKIAIGLYLGRSSMGSSYGVAGSFVVLLVWVFYSAQILFLGAEFTEVYANRYGSRIVPDENAEVTSQSGNALKKEKITSPTKLGFLCSRSVPFGPGQIS
jgi:membrane protein